MIITRDKNIEQIEYRSGDDTDDTPTYVYFCESLVLTKDMIPKVLFIDGLHSTIDLNGNSIDRFNIYLTNVTISFSNLTIANIYLKLFTTDFENIDIKTTYPELFL